MIKDLKKWQEWEARWQKQTPVDIDKNFEIVEEMIQHARLFGKWPPKDPLEGIETDIKIARIINTYVKSSSG